MTDNTLTFETCRGAPMQENAVVETIVSAAFPTGFSTNPAVGGGNNDVMVVIDTTVLTSRSGAINQLMRIIKGIEQSTNFPTG